MPLHKKLIKNIKFKIPTPIQRKSIPQILNLNEFIGISQTGSGKTLAYMVPLVQLAIDGKRALVVVPTKELKNQVEGVRNELCRGINFREYTEECDKNDENDKNNNSKTPAEEILSHFQNSNPITITTPGQIKNMIKKFEIVVLDEMDILIDEFYNDLKMINDDEQIKRNIELIKSGDIKKNRGKDQVKGKGEDKSLNINYLANTQLIGFSATLPSKTSHFFSNPVIVKEREGLSDSLISFFFYVRDNKDQFLLFLLRKFENALIFVSNRYTAKYLEELINSAVVFNERKDDTFSNEQKKDFLNSAQSLYSSLDDESRSEIYNNFKSKKTKFLIVTDIAARGLHIQDLEILINYDMADEKVFLHRVGRVARNRKGAVFSLVTSLDIHHYIDIKATYYENKDCYLFDSPYYKSKGMLNSTYDELESIRNCGMRAYKKSLKFRKHVVSQKDSSLLINNLKEFNFDALDDIFNKTDFFKERSGERNNLLENIRNYRQFGSDDSKVGQKEEVFKSKDEIKSKDDFKDQFYIPYRSKKSRSVHSSVFSIQKD